MPYIVEDGVRLYYEEMGSGTPILFIHPPEMGHIVFRHQQSLSSHFRIIMYDMRGNGKSSPSNRPITIPLLADDICRLLNTLDVNKSGDNSFVFNPIPAIISVASPRETIPATTESKPFQENLANFAPNAAPASFVNTAKHLIQSLAKYARVRQKIRRLPR